jgi:hypothetical protein
MESAQENHKKSKELDRKLLKNTIVGFGKSSDRKNNIQHIGEP